MYILPTTDGPLKTHNNVKLINYLLSSDSKPVCKWLIMQATQVGLVVMSHLVAVCLAHV